MGNFNLGDLKRNQILKGFQDDIEKARHGVYADNAQNRRLQRVGQEYGKAAQKKEETSEQSSASEEGVSLQNHARSASEEALKKVANDPTADSQMRKVATQELERRGINIRSKNKAGASSLRDNSVDSDAKENSKFESLGFRKLDNVDLQTYSGVENPDHAYIKQVGNDEDGYDIIAVSEDGKWRVDKYPYNEVDNFESSLVDAIEDVDKVISKYDKSVKKEEDLAAKYVKNFDDYTTGNADSFDSKGFKAYIKSKGAKSAIKELADYIRENPVDDEYGEQSDITDDEIADVIENMLVEADIEITDDIESALDKMRDEDDSEELSDEEQSIENEMRQKRKDNVTKRLNFIAEDMGISKKDMDKMSEYFYNSEYDDDEDIKIKRATSLAKNIDDVAKVINSYAGNEDKDKEYGSNEGLSAFMSKLRGGAAILLDPAVMQKGIGKNILGNPKLKKYVNAYVKATQEEESLKRDYDKLSPEDRKVSMFYPVWKKMSDISEKFVDELFDIYGK